MTLVTPDIQQLIDNAKNIVFLTGAGVSTASGIPDYRSIVVYLALLMSLFPPYRIENGKSAKKAANTWIKNNQSKVDAWSAAKKIADAMRIDDIKDPFTVHRAVVTAFSMFDEQMVAWNLPEIYASEFATLTPVLSERQLRLPLAQVFDIKHMTMIDRNTDKEAYAGLLKNSGQNSFVLAAPEDKLADFFKELYQTPVKEVLTKLGQPFAIR